MILELTDEQVAKIAEIQGTKYRRELTAEQIIETALTKYHERVLYENEYQSLVIDRKRRILRFQDFLCFYCGKFISYSLATLDHKIPTVDGGKNETENLCVCCADCNSDKSDMPVHKYLLFRLQEGLPVNLESVRFEGIEASR